MDNPETLETLGTKEKGRRQTKQKQKHIQHRKLISYDFYIKLMFYSSLFLGGLMSYLSYLCFFVGG
jgi:hypothetical protein